MVSSDDILVVNAGSTSLKLHLVDERERSRPLGEAESEAARGLGAERRGEWEGLHEVWGKARAVRAVAHRVVHGGARFCDPVLIDADVLEQIFALELLAPLHNAPALRGIERAREALPDVPQVAVFDTGFHSTIPAEAAVYALPRRWREGWGVRRYGFHGLSVQWCTERAPQLMGAEGLRLVVCHLGGGCSVSAVRGGRSLDTTMGFSPLEGVPMGTRSGSVDPGALVYLLRERKLSVEELEHALNFDSGLRGLGGGSGSMVALERAAAAEDSDAQLAIEVFAYRVAGAVAAMAVAAKGIDALVFTAGIGEGSVLARERICERLGFLGVELDPARNRSAEPDGDVSTEGATTQHGKATVPQDATMQWDRDVSAERSPVRVLVIHAREEVIAARPARALLDAP
jgi:acetate kinase